VSDVRELARGRWPAILGKWLDERAIAGKHTYCPMCGGKDRWRFDNKDGTGSWICSHDGAGDGFHLLQNLNNWSFAEAAKYVESVAGRFKAMPPPASPSPDAALEALRRVWTQTQKIEAGDPVHRYLERRCGITSIPGGLRHHTELPYRHEDGSVTHHPAMIARVAGSDGLPITLHRTYLTGDGQKANVPTVRKLMSPVRKLENSSVRLAKPVDGWMGVAEGIETALCASKRYQMPVWACVSAGLMETFRPPEGVSMVTVFGDNDRSFTGQASAYKLARAIVSLGIECRVAIPSVAGTDWADEAADGSS
jgi:putative DNA primase/helicase